MDTKNTALFKKKSHFDPKRLVGITDDCSLVYLEEYKQGNRWLHRVKDRIPFTTETAQFIIEIDEELRREELQQEYDAKHADYDVLNKQSKQTRDEGDNEFDTEPVECIPDPRPSSIDRLFMDEEQMDPMEAKIRAAVETCSEKQQDIFYGHFGELKQLEKMRVEEETATGKVVSQQAFFDRKKKLIQSVARHLGVEPPKRIKK